MKNKLLLSLLAITLPVISSSALVDSNATQETQDLYALLEELNDANGVAFGGQYALFQGLYADGSQWYNSATSDMSSDIKNICGIHPSVSGWDISEDAFYGDSWAQQNIAVIKRAYEMGAIICLSFHEGNPITGGDYNDVTDTDLSKVLEGGSAHEAFLEDWETAADFIAQLKTDDGTMIPVILRPFHELTGSWFWWGSNTDKEEFVEMWQWLVTYLRDTKGLHNILYVYNTDKITSSTTYLARWPGDDYVDIVSCDVYLADTDSTSKLTTSLGIVIGVSEDKGKPAALSETGPSAGNDDTTVDNWWTTKVFNPINNAGYFSKIAYIAGWANWSGNVWMPYPGSHTAANFRTFLQDSRIFLLDHFNTSCQWTELTQLGNTYTKYYPWVYSENQGWECMTEIFTTNLVNANWYYDTYLGWIWTRKKFYPYFWSSVKNGWVYYHSTTDDGTRWFYSYVDGAWVSYPLSGY
jgi:mannan endo-1,4-beta-mannosidase